MDGPLAIHPFPLRKYYQHRATKDAYGPRAICSSRPRSYAFNLKLRPGGHSVPLATQFWTAYVPRIADGRAGHRESSFGGLRGLCERSGYFETFCGKVSKYSASQGPLKGGPSSFKARRTQPARGRLLTSFKRKGPAPGQGPGAP